MQNGLAFEANLITETKLRCGGSAKVLFEVLRRVSDFRRFGGLHMSRLETL